MQNTKLAISQEFVDNINTEFYEKIKYPWTPYSFEKLEEDRFFEKMISQDLGYWGDLIIPETPIIWVAGCGTNQALITALKFPTATIVGSDLSNESLKICAKNARDLGIKNIELKQESINEVNYKKEFDIIICTGVVHHNANPEHSLNKLSEALKPSGIMELMVYNSFHRIYTSAFQNAIRLLTGESSKLNLEAEILIARKFTNTFKKNNHLSVLLSSAEAAPDAAFADALLQPVEYSFTVESLEKIASKCNLEILVSCIDQFSKADGNFEWNIDLDDPQLQEIYMSLPDTKRWQITNLLLGENSPLLWFYLQKKDSPRLRKSEKNICDEFLSTVFSHNNTHKEFFSLQENGSYKASSNKTNFPAPPLPSSYIYNLLKNLDPTRPIGETIALLDVKNDFMTINKIRINSATSSFPYLKSHER